MVNAKFNSPFEEFGLLMELRRARLHGGAGTRMLTQRPLAIYTSAERYDLWQLGRSPGRFVYHQLLQQGDQVAVPEPDAIELDIRRDYVVLYGWVKGGNAEEMLDAGALSQ